MIISNGGSHSAAENGEASSSNTGSRQASTGRQSRFAQKQIKNVSARASEGPQGYFCLTTAPPRGDNAQNP